MREPFLRSFSSSSQDLGKNFPADSADSWLNRIRENLAQLLLPSSYTASSANGAPIHLLKFEKSSRPARAQGASLIAHVAIFAGLIYLVSHATAPNSAAPLHGSTPLGNYTFPPNILRSLMDANPSAGSGSGGANNPIPARQGDPPPFSSIVLVRPSLPQNRDSQVPIPPTLLDPSAPPILAPTPNIGLPWMHDDTNSGGPGPGHTIGAVGGDSMGDNGSGQIGDGEPGQRYGPSFTMPVCAYCPYPTYSDDARHGKVQGAVTMQVLVGADGRAHEIRVVKGIGFGLDERAVETVRGWRFIPARDASKHTVAAWVTVEAVFRLL